jgi:hypothetical protein
MPVGIWFSTIRDKELALKRWETNKKNTPKEMIPQTTITWVISGFPAMYKNRRSSGILCSVELLTLDP